VCDSKEIEEFNWIEKITHLTDNFGIMVVLAIAIWLLLGYFFQWLVSCQRLNDA